MNRNCYCISQ